LLLSGQASRSSRENQFSGCHIQMRLMGVDARQQRTLHNPLRTRRGHALRCIVPGTCPPHMHFAVVYSPCLLFFARILLTSEFYEGSQINAAGIKIDKFSLNNTTQIQLKKFQKDHVSKLAG